MFTNQNKNPITNPLTASHYKEKINSLELQLQRAEAQFTKKKQTYQDIISSLQEENQKLKALIQDSSIQCQDISLKEDQPLYANNAGSNLILRKISPKNISQKKVISKSVYSQNMQAYFTLGSKASKNQIQVRKQGQSTDNNKINSDMKDPSHQNDYLLQQFIQQNNYLKEQLSNISINYQRQIQELTSYFQKIKNRQEQINKKRQTVNYKNADKNGSQVKAHYEGKLTFIIELCETIFQDTHQQRQKYQTKIIELVGYIKCYEQKIKQLQKQLQRSNQKDAFLTSQKRIYQRLNYALLY